MKKKYLVVGGAGYIGSHTCKALVKAGNEIVVYDNLSLGHSWAVRWGELVVGDLHDEGKLTQVLQKGSFNAVLHFAANAYVGESVYEPLKYYSNNVAGTLSLLRAMAAAEVKNIVFSSTCATYGIPQSLPIEEDFSQNPINPYGHSKKMVEQIFLDLAAQEKLNAACLRFFNAAGADAELEIGESHDPETHIIPLVIEAANSPSKTFSILGTDYPTEDGTCVRDYIHVTDLADAHVRALSKIETRQNGFSAWNLGTGKGYSVLQVIKAVESRLGKSVRIEKKSRRPGDPPVLIASGNQARSELGWNPTHSNLENIVDTAVRWSEAKKRVTA